MAASRSRRAALLALAVGALALAAPQAGAQSWVFWNSINTGTGVAQGTITTPGGPVNVTVNGNFIGGQTSGGGGTGYWNPPSTWNGGGSSPDNPGYIQVNQAARFTVTFSSPVDLYMALLSVGQANDPITYNFGTSAFSIVSQGPSSTWGGCNTCLTPSGNTVTGLEGDGTLHFVDGTTNTLTFSTTPDEFWHGFTFGAAVTTTPEPASFVLLGTGLIGVFGVARRRRNR